MHAKAGATVVVWFLGTVLGTVPDAPAPGPSSFVGSGSMVRTADFALRLTYVGPQDHPIPGLVLLGSGVPNVARGDHEPELPVHHANDALVGSVTVPASSLRLHGIVGDISGLAEQSAATGPGDAKVAVALILLASPDSTREWYMDRRTTRLLLASLRRHLAEDSTALAAVSTFSASMGYRQVP
jgi:hypothetical protein